MNRKTHTLLITLALPAPFPVAVMVFHIRSLNGIEAARVQHNRLAPAQPIATMTDWCSS